MLHKNIFVLPASGSPAAATAKAAFAVLVAIVPSQAAALDTTYHNYLANNGLSETDPGVTVGQAAAAGILALRANDGRVPSPLPPAFIGGTAPGQWRPTPSDPPAGPPPSFAPMLISWLGSVPPFTLKSGDQFRAKAPPKLTSKQYAEDYNEVKALGVRTNSARTPAQDQLAYFYAGNNFILWIRVLRDVGATYTTNIGDNARLLALGTLAIADSFIAAWADKSYYVFWRPVTAIQEGENDGNPKTVGDPNWQPLINTPSFPEYTSGHVTYSSAAGRILKLFFKTDQVPFTVTSANPLAKQKVRNYTRFSDAVEETIDARVYAGIHFRTADVVGRDQGKRVAHWAFKHFLRPVKR